MFTERTSVGLHVHALSVRACGLDTIAGQLIEETFTPSPDHVRDWLRQMAGIALVGLDPVHRHGATVWVAYAVSAT